MIMSEQQQEPSTSSGIERVEGFENATSKNNTPYNTAGDLPDRDNVRRVSPLFGGQTIVQTSGNFPALGSTLGPYFSVGRLGAGTFCSIHKCVNLHYYHNSTSSDEQKQNPSTKNISAASSAPPHTTSSKPTRLAAAKVEIGDFKNSGVLVGEATMLHFLDTALSPEAVPIYMGHYRAGEISAIVMEYLPGQDMHRIRDWATKQTGSRRLTVKDAVYMTAGWMLPLLKKMHKAGIVHRDVKPSNVVKRSLKDFCMVDFGLSKSIVVPKESPYSDQDHPWTGTACLLPPNTPGHFRKERSTADFRGTSMYASVRVHQLKDYCPRDDLWSLLYVFCDLVSGGLPWMAHAASRDRESCQILKERIHGEKEGHSDQTSRLLMGDDYHRGLYKKYKGNVDSILDSELEDDAQDVPEPLPLYKDEKKVELLRKAFRHLGTLNFWDTPDYDLIKQCLEGFLEGEDTSSNDASTIPINWELLAESAEKSKKTKTTTEHILFKDVPTWDFVDDAARDPIDSSMFYDAEKRQSEKAAAGEVAAEEATKLTGEAADMARLPLEMKFRIAQMEYNTSHHSSIPLHLALRDWLKVALPILYGEWDSRRFEKGGHRSNEDGYRRETYLRIVEKCLKCADRFNGFRGIDSICSQGNGENGSIVKNEEAGFVEKEVKIEIEQETAPKRKRRKILSTLREPSSGSLGSDLIAISQVSFQLRAAKKAEEKKSFAPPPRLLFGSSSAR